MIMRGFLKILIPTQNSSFDFLSTVNACQQSDMNNETHLQDPVRWVSARELARIIGILPQTLANWRHLDLREGRDRAAPGKPAYRRFGRAVRYAVLPDGTPVLAPKIRQATPAGENVE